jgi:hypothetical protein
MIDALFQRREAFLRSNLSRLTPRAQRLRQLRRTLAVKGRKNQQGKYERESDGDQPPI